MQVNDFGFTPYRTFFISGRELKWAFSINSPWYGKSAEPEKGEVQTYTETYKKTLNQRRR